MTAGRTLNTLSRNWGTPDKYVHAIRRFFDGDIQLDPCSNEYSIVHALVEYRLPDNDGLKDSWCFNKIYVNPPYGIDKERKTSIKDWIRRCAESSEEFDAEVLALIPVATNTKHWKNYIFGRATSICFLYDTRLRFLINGCAGGKGAPMACVMVYWGKDFKKFKSVFQNFGAVVDIRSLKVEAIHI